MNRRYIFILCFILISSGLYPDENLKEYNKSFSIWKNAGISEYTIKIRYTAFSPFSGLWEFKVKDGEIYNPVFNGKGVDVDRKFIRKFTMANLYNIAGESVADSKKVIFLIKVVYREKGFIESVAKVRNPEYKKRVKTDSLYKIEVLDFIPGGS